jgi:hypothetical protein
MLLNNLARYVLRVGGKEQVYVVGRDVESFERLCLS